MRRINSVQAESSDPLAVKSQVQTARRTCFHSLLVLYKQLSGIELTFQCPKRMLYFRSDTGLYVLSLNGEFVNTSVLFQHPHLAWHFYNQPIQLLIFGFLLFLHTMIAWVCRNRWLFSKHKLEVNVGEKVAFTFTTITEFKTAFLYLSCFHVVTKIHT